MLLGLLLLFSCGERRQVQAYLTSVSTEIPRLQQIGRDTEKAFDDLRFGKRPKDLNELAKRLEQAADNLKTQLEELKTSRQKVSNLPTPAAANEFDSKLLNCYDSWTEVGGDVESICRRAAQACREVEASPPKGKWKKFAEAAKQLGDEGRQLKKAVRDANHASQDLSRELEKLQRKYKLAKLK